MNLCWIGLIGKNGAGKSTACAYLKSRGFWVYSLSDIVRQEVQRLHLTADRDTLISTANQLKLQHGTSYFAKESISLALKAGHKQVVFDSIRHPDEAQILKDKKVYLCGIDAPISLRFQRIQGRHHETDLVSFETFIAQEQRESDGESFGQNLNKTFSFCEQVINNDQDESHLFTLLDQFITIQCNV